MYSLGILDEGEVTDSYKALGYDDQNANRMTQFVVKSTRQSLSKFSSANVVTAFTKRFIDEGQAGLLLRDMGIKDTEINNIIQTAQYKRDWANKEEQITAIENLYKKGRYDEGVARNKLSQLNLPNDQITTLLEQWIAKIDVVTPANWTATQTLTFLKKGLIGKERAKTEFIALGYDDEHIRVYLQSAEA
jgi:hypothetical protein